MYYAACDQSVEDKWRVGVRTNKYKVEVGTEPLKAPSFKWRAKQETKILWISSLSSMWMTMGSLTVIGEVINAWAQEGVSSRNEEMSTMPPRNYETKFQKCKTWSLKYNASTRYSITSDGNVDFGRNIYLVRKHIAKSGFHAENPIWHVDDPTTKTNIRIWNLSTLRKTERMSAYTSKLSK